MSILRDWSEDHTAKFQKDILTFRHGLNETGLFTDEALIALLDKHPSEQLDVCTMEYSDDPDFPNRFRTGDFREAGGQVILEAAKAGRIWVNLRKAMNLHPEYVEVLDQMYGGIAEKTGKKPYKANGGILISSPIAKVPYHFDKTETILWHVRGKKRIYIYPLTQDFIPDTAYEAAAIDFLDDDLPYKDSFDDHATIIDLEEDQAVTWPMNSPHRVDNSEFCVSVTTEYTTRASSIKNAGMIANATLRHKLGMNPSWSNAGPANRYGKYILGQILRKSGFGHTTSHTDMVTFKLDRAVPDYIRDIAPVERSF